MDSTQFLAVYTIKSKRGSSGIGLLRIQLFGPGASQNENVNILLPFIVHCDYLSSISTYPAGDSGLFGTNTTDLQIPEYTLDQRAKTMHTGYGFYFHNQTHFSHFYHASVKDLWLSYFLKETQSAGGASSSQS